MSTFINLIFAIAIATTIMSTAKAKTVKEEQVPKKEVEIISIDGTNWTNPDNIEGMPQEFFISQEGYMCQSKIATFWLNGVQQAGRMCRMPDGAWRVLH
tara:strand:+ start:136 stop:432 length:297 start_codon:yes stop_codon:yes gene_type:complete